MLMALLMALQGSQMQGDGFPADKLMACDGNCRWSFPAAPAARFVSAPGQVYSPGSR